MCNQQNETLGNAAMPWYRTPDSYTVGTSAYYEWLNAGSDYGTSAEHGYMNTNPIEPGPPQEQDIVEVGGSTFTPTDPVPLVATIDPATGQVVVTHTPTPSPLASLFDANGKLFGFEPIYVLGAAAIAAYVLFGKK